MFMKEPVVELKKEHQLIQPLFLAEGLLEMLLALLEVMLCVERVLDMSPLETTLNKVRTNRNTLKFYSEANKKCGRFSFVILAIKNVIIGATKIKITSSTINIL